MLCFGWERDFCVIAGLLTRLPLALRLTSINDGMDDLGQRRPFHRRIENCERMLQAHRRLDGICLRMCNLKACMHYLIDAHLE